MTSARLLQYASFLSGYNYSVKCKKGKENQNVNCLSKASLKYSESSTNELIGKEVNQIYAEAIYEISSEEITAITIQKETANYPKLKKIINDLKSTSVDTEYTLMEGILFRQDRVYIPGRLRSRILQELHQTHLGITKMKQLAHRYAYWKNLDRDIEHIVKSCENCALTKATLPKVIVHPWNTTQENWERIHIDYAGPLDNKFLLVVVDAKSKWAEIRIINNTPNSQTTIVLLENIFLSNKFSIRQRYNFSKRRI